MKIVKFLFLTLFININLFANSIVFENINEHLNFVHFVIILFIILLIILYRQYLLNLHNNRLQVANKEIKIKTRELQKKSRELSKQKELFEKIYYESSDGIFLYLLKEKKIIDCNDVSFKLLGYENKEEFLKLKDKDLFPMYQIDGSCSTKRIEKMFDIALKKGSNSFEFLYKKKDDSSIWLEVVVTSILIDGQELLHIVWRDINERKKMEERLNILTYKLEEKVEEEVRKNEEKTKQLIEQSRLAQMGEMISMIAHQWRQPLTAISATTNNLLIKMMIDKNIEKEEFQNEITLISKYSQHLSMTINDFRNFFRTDKEKTETTLEAIIESSLSIMKSSLKSYNIKILKDYKCNKNFELFSTEVGQVIINLIKNAEDTLVEKQIANPYIKIKTYKDNSFVVLEISDNAKGVPLNIINKIFDPYFSTKKDKDGTGLGLYMSKIIINEHCKGKLSVSNSKNGAVFKVEIPII